MNKYIILSIVVIVIVVLIVTLIMVNTSDTGDFSLIYGSGAEKYKDVIEKGVNRWSSIGVGGIIIKFTINNNIPSNIIAQTTGVTVQINDSVFSQSSNNIRILTIAHEVGHALGIGIWDITQPSVGGVFYLSPASFPKAAQAYIDNVRPNGITLPGPPLATGANLGVGSAFVHWSSSSSYGMQRDIMVARISSSSTVISIVDLTVLSEKGRKVDLSRAESLQARYIGAIMEYVYGKEESKHHCGSCEDCDH